MQLRALTVFSLLAPLALGQLRPGPEEIGCFTETECQNSLYIDFDVLPSPQDCLELCRVSYADAQNLSLRCFIGKYAEKIQNISRILYKWIDFVFTKYT